MPGQAYPGGQGLPRKFGRVCAQRRRLRWVGFHASPEVASVQAYTQPRACRSVARATHSVTTQKAGQPQSARPTAGSWRAVLPRAQRRRACVGSTSQSQTRIQGFCAGWSHPTLLAVTRCSGLASAVSGPRQPATRHLICDTRKPAHTLAVCPPQRSPQRGAHPPVLQGPHSSHTRLCKSSRQSRASRMPWRMPLPTTCLQSGGMAQAAELLPPSKRARGS
jgi:hypothetical protein